MSDKFEDLVKNVYKNWKDSLPKDGFVHPDEEDLACFLDGKLTGEELDHMYEHLTACDKCMRIVAEIIQAQDSDFESVPVELKERVKDFLFSQEDADTLEVLLSFKNGFVEVLKAGGDILLGQEVIPVPVLRSRSIKGFKDSVTIFKDFKDVRVQIRVDNKENNKFNIQVVVKDRVSQKALKDLRISLLQQDTELESYVVDTGSVIFEHIPLGSYKVAIADIQKNLVFVLVDIKA